MASELKLTMSLLASLEVVNSSGTLMEKLANSWVLNPSGAAVSVCCPSLAYLGMVEGGELDCYTRRGIKYCKKCITIPIRLGLF